MEKLLMKLVKYTDIQEPQFIDYIQEWENKGEKVIPSATNRKDRSFTELLDQWAFDETDEVHKKGFVPASLYFLMDGDGRIIGAIHLRHELNEKLLHTGGHIGYGIRPSERSRGYATLMLSMFLKEKKVRELKKVLLTCDDDNIPSSKTIENCNGVLWDKVEDEGKVIRRYWINIVE